MALLGMTAKKLKRLVAKQRAAVALIVQMSNKYELGDEFILQCTCSTVIFQTHG